ncbi:DMT family transporter [Marinoscillum furvescens]|uniref:EamA domain-containing membrane protein RarD n=1 Tax=Marinoscillum furvescens DSM 4134 TaxID=1122208 RepID=A0A3D9KYK8_MARFU|nr:DMT family transporter [Marinoscillum furvescens]RED92826.1 EamA domain-containing membrane protein RarD [Marinoscillum furvescens DSM 4134]
MNTQLSHFLQLGLAIVVMSSSGTLGRYIDMSPPVTIWVRCVIGAVALYAVLKVFGIDTSPGSRRNYGSLILSALLLGAHWVTYFFALQYSNVAIGMLALFTYPVMTALLEPIILKTPFQKLSIVLAIVAFAGVAMLVPELTFENNFTFGITLGVLSALFYSLRNIMLKKKVSGQSGITLMFYQLLVISLVLWPVLFLEESSFMTSFQANWQGILILGLFTTATGHTLFVLSFKNFSISTVSIISSLTPLIGIFLGYIFLNEVPAGKTLFGGFLIFITVIAESIHSVRSSK